MAFVNYNNKEITAKIVYYGPALSGKTTCLQYVFKNGQYKQKGKLITLDTDGDRTLFFDFLPVEIGKVGDYSIKMQLYTVPGQVAYNTTRKLVLQGADGIVFVADSQMIMHEMNIESFGNLKENLSANNIVYEETPLILQYNKRDLKEIVPTDMLNKDLNQDNKAFFPTIATTGENVLEALHSIMKMVIIHLKNKLSIFQKKDETVLFSRDEISDTFLNGPNGKTKNNEENPTSADTEKEEIFELPTSMADEPMKTVAFRKEDDIFDLSDETRVEDSGEDLEVPEVVINDELDIDDKATRAVDLEKLGKKKTKKIHTGPLEMEESGKEYELKKEHMLEVPGSPTQGKIDLGTDIPIRIEIPDDKDEIRINLNLQIVIKKK